MESEKKKRRLVYHELDGIKPLPAGTQPSQVGRVLPEFLHNALFAAPIDVPHEFCPFKRYINLVGRAWEKEGESIYLIERPCYESLLTFVKWRFSTREADTQQRTVVTGSAGIGKTFFALYAARAFFEGGEFVVLYYKNAVWAFSKKSPAELLKGVGEDVKQMLSEGLGLKKAPQPDGNDFWFARLTDKAHGFQQCLNEWGESGLAIFIRDPGEDKSPLELMDTRGRELYTVSVGQETFLATIREKNMVVEAIYQRIAELWSVDEYTYAEALGLI